MKVILLQDIKNVGRKDQIINANDGYARNFLFPKKLAVEATKDNLLKLQAKKDSTAHKKNLEIEANKEIAKKIENITLELKVKAGPELVINENKVSKRTRVKKKPIEKQWALKLKKHSKKPYLMALLG